MLKESGFVNLDDYRTIDRSSFDDQLVRSAGPYSQNIARIDSQG